MLREPAVSRIVAGALALSAWAVFAATANPDVTAQLHIRLTMRDGVHLDTNVFRPAIPGRVPALLFRTPYGKGVGLLPGYRAFLDHGFAVVTQDVRGRFASEGVFDSLHDEGEDGYDTIDWIARQWWSSGRVGMIGGSYRGIVQWKAAVLDNPHLLAICPSVSGWDDYTDRFYSTGGALKLAHRLVWMSENVPAPGFRAPALADYIYHLPLRTIDRSATGEQVGFFQQALDHPGYDGFWRNLSVREKIGRVHAAVFSIAGWYDNYAESDLGAFSALRAKGAPAAIVVGPWAHNMMFRFHDSGFGAQVFAPVRRYQIAWLERWLDPPPARAPRAIGLDAPLRIFVMGSNQWRDEQEWPLKRTCYTPLYLSGGGRANTASGDGALSWRPAELSSSDHFLYDPTKPVPTEGGAVCCDPSVLPWGPMDQAAVERRRDVLVYTGDVLREPVEVTGVVRASLSVATSARDTDFTAKLVDVLPGGATRNVVDGILRLRYRGGLDKAVLARPGEVYPITIDLGVTSYGFLPGHRLRLEVSSSNFPRFDRNPNTGRPIADERFLRTASQTVLHGPQFASHLLLPVIPSGAGACLATELTSPAVARYSPKKSLPVRAR